jgi:hypothetical protein
MLSAPTHAGLDHAGAGEDVGHGHDLAGVLGIDHCRAARHREHVVAEQRTDREVLDAGGVLGGRAVRAPMRSLWANRPRWVWNSLPARG